MSVRVQTYVWQLDLPPSQKLVAIALADHCHDDGSEARPSQALLSRKTGLDTRSIRRILHALQAAGVITLARQARQNRANCYSFNLPPDFATLRPDTVSSLRKPRPDIQTARPDTVSSPDRTLCPPNHKEPSLETISAEKFFEIRKRNRQIFRELPPLE